MFEIITLLVFLWLVAKTIGLALRLTWGAAKIAASLLIALACPILIVCFLFLGSLALIIPVAMVAIAAGIVKACVS